MKRLYLFLFSCIVLLSGCTGPIAQQYRYPAEITGIGDNKTFPLKAAGYNRGKFFMYKTNTLNFSVGYDAFNQELQNAVTFYFYIEPTEMDLQYEHEKQQISYAHKGATLLQENIMLFEKNGISHTGQVAQYRYNEVFAHEQQDVFSELILIKLPDRYVKVRSTSPFSQAAVSQKKVRELMEAVNWAP